MRLKVIGLLMMAGSILYSQQNIAQTWEFAPGTKDTINYTDVTGKKQRHWILFGKHKPNGCFKPTQKAEEGEYKENRKVGQWVEFYCNGNKRSQITFVNGRADGHAVMYYENGNIQEEGIWKNNRWTGELKQYYENGQVQHDFKYNAAGKREGEQVYKYDNGQTAIVGNFNNGKETGTIKEYHDNGSLKAEKTFNNGNVDVASIKTFENKDAKKEEKKDVLPKEQPIAKVKPDEKPLDAKAGGPVILNGKHTLYDKNRNVTKDGIFKDNRLMEGKSYIYDANGILQKINIYRNGMFIGEGVIEK